MGGCGSDDGKELIPVSKVKTRQWGSMQSSAGQWTSTGSLVKRSLPSVIQGPIIRSVDYPSHMLSPPLPSGWLPASLLINRENIQNISVHFRQPISIICIKPCLSSDSVYILIKSGPLAYFDTSQDILDSF